MCEEEALFFATISTVAINVELLRVFWFYPCITALGRKWDQCGASLLLLFEISESYIILLNSLIHWFVFSPAFMVVGVCRSLSQLLWECKVHSWQVGSLLQGHIERQTTMCSRTYTHSQIRVCLNYNRYACDIDLIQKALFFFKQNN